MGQVLGILSSVVLGVVEGGMLGAAGDVVGSLAALDCARSSLHSVHAAMKQAKRPLRRSSSG